MAVRHKMTPDDVSKVDPEFTTLYADVTCEGALIAARSRVAFVGLARDCVQALPANLALLEETARHFESWSAFVFENDSTDGTRELLEQWAAKNPENVAVQCVTNGKPRLGGFEVERVLAMADYRKRCQDVVRETMPDVDYVIVVDLDAQGGWSLHGVINGIGWHAAQAKLGCLGSVSLCFHPGVMINGKPSWCHYDAWAYRWIGWQARMGPWFTMWLPPVGAPPIECNSVFGGLAIYKREAYLQGTYGLDGDCEHVGLHRTMQSMGWRIAINPSQRTLMDWADAETTDGGRNLDDQYRAVPD